MLRVVIVEDESEHAQRLQALLQVYEKKQNERLFQVKYYSNPRRFLADYACDADLIFLDIQMPELDGISAARAIRNQDSRVMLIFTTALAQYAIVGYEVQAFDYILKPLKAEIFETKLARALRMLDYSRAEEWIDISTKTETRRIGAGRVTYIEVKNHDILLHTENEVFRHWGNLREYEQKLTPIHFARCNTSFLVNMKHVTCIQSDTVQVGREQLPISRSRRKEFLMAFAKYKGGSR